MMLHSLSKIAFATVSTHHCCLITILWKIWTIVLVQIEIPGHYDYFILYYFIIKPFTAIDNYSRSFLVHKTFRDALLETLHSCQNLGYAWASQVWVLTSKWEKIRFWDLLIHLWLLFWYHLHDSCFCLWNLECVWNVTVFACVAVHVYVLVNALSWCMHSFHWYNLNYNIFVPSEVAVNWTEDSWLVKVSNRRWFFLTPR